MKIAAEFYKGKWFDACLLLGCLAIFLVFGPSFGVFFCCGVSLMLMILKRINVRKRPMIRRMLIAAALIVGFTFLLIESLVLSEFSSDDGQNHDVDAAVILGAGLRGSELSMTLRQRLDAGLHYLRSHEKVPVLLSGGRGPGEDLTEAEAMKDYLIRNGISKDRIMLEEQSTSTEENLLFSRRILTEKGFKAPKIMLITSDYHMFRSKLIARKMGFEALGVASESPFYLKLNYMIREYFATIKTML